MPYVHLANGDVETLTDKEWAKAQNDAGAAGVFRKDGKEFQVIGVYPEEVEHPKSEEELAVDSEKEKADREEFDAWKASR
jgi:hypothetical protein